MSDIQDNETTNTMTTATSTAELAATEPAKYTLRPITVSKETVIRDFSKWDKSRLRFDPFIEGKNEKSGVVFHNSKIQYDYGTPDKPDFRDLKVESPKTSSPYGISEYIPKDSQVGTGKWSIACFYDLNKERDRVFLQTIIHDIYVAAANHTAAHGPAALKSKGFSRCDRNLDPANTRSDFNYPIKYKKEEVPPPSPIPEDYKARQRIIPGSKPMISYDVRLTGKKSNFHSDDDPPKEIPQVALKAGGIIHVPLIQFTSVFIGAANKVKACIHSSCVDEFIEANSTGLGELLAERKAQGVSTSESLGPALSSVMEMARSLAVEKKAPESSSTAPSTAPSQSQGFDSTAFAVAAPQPSVQAGPPAYQPQPQHGTYAQPGYNAYTQTGPYSAQPYQHHQPMSHGGIQRI